MTRTAEYVGRLAAGEDPERLALAESGLPGPRGNLELIAAIARSADEASLRRWAALDPEAAPGDAPPVVLAVAGIVGLGRFVRERDDIVGILHDLASDPRWRVREGVAMAFQLAAGEDPRAVVDILAPWASNSYPLVQRAVVAALCEPELLRDRVLAEEVVDLLDRVTASLLERADRRAEGVRVLRQALGYGWSVAIVHAHEHGREVFDRWLTVDDPDIRWIGRENLRKKRLRALDPDWVSEHLARLS